MKDIAEELLFSIKWIPLEERKSKQYLEYLDKVNLDLKEHLKTKNNGNR